MIPALFFALQTKACVIWMCLLPGNVELQHRQGSQQQGGHRGVPYHHLLLEDPQLGVVPLAFPTGSLSMPPPLYIH